MPAAGSKDAPKNHQELKDDTKASREEKLVSGNSFLFVIPTFEFVCVLRT